MENNVLNNLLIELLKNSSYRLRSSLAEGDGFLTPKELLTALSFDEDKDIRSLVARNSNTSKEDLKRLSHDEDSWVRWGVAMNPNTPKEDLERLSKDEHFWVRQAVERNPNYIRPKND